MTYSTKGSIVAAVIGALLAVGVYWLVAHRADGRTSPMQDEHARTCLANGHFIKKEGQHYAARGGSGSVAFTYWCTDEDGHIYDLWFDSGRDHRSGPIVSQ